MLFIREDPVTDPVEMATYGAANRAAAAIFSGRYGIKPLSVYSATEAFEGPNPDGVILLEFPSSDDARAWYGSPEYQAALQHRLRGATYRAILLDGVAP